MPMVILAGTDAHAEDQRGQLHGPVACGPQAPKSSAEPLSGETRIRAEGSHGSSERFVLEGNVLIESQGRQLQADQVIFDQRANRAEAEGNVRFSQPNLKVYGTTGSTQIEGEQAEFEQTHYELPQRGAHGSAGKIEIHDKDRSSLHKVTYTTCLPDDKDWELSAKQVDLNRAEGTGRARDVTMRVGGVPILYAPSMSFPIDDRRKTGFLAPSFGNSDQDGADVRIPFYWNIAPNRDATLQPRLLSKRGVQLGAEYRYLRQDGQGQFAMEVLPDDDLTQEDRYLFTYRHNGQFDRRWYTEAELGHASDRAYFEDLGDNLSITSLTNLERRIDLSYEGDIGQFLARLQNFLPMGATQETYERLPQLLLNLDLPWHDKQLRFTWDNEFTRFDHREPVTTGDRLDTYPALLWDWQRPAYFVRPKLGVRHTRYRLKNFAVTADDTPSRTTPIYSLDTGLFLEREARWGGNDYELTLEPRLYYLYVADKDHTGIPLFDTGLFEFGYDQLFRENRFTGADRQGDANQLTVALTSRALSRKNGREKLRLTLGQIHYFDDRNVTLNSGPAETDSRSDWVGDVAYSWPNAYVNLAAQYNPDSERTAKTTLRWHYQSDQRHILNLAYRYQRDDLEQTDLSMFWPLGQKWQIISRWNYSLREDRTLEGLLGLEYDTCCWAARLVGRQYITGTDTEDTAIYLQFVLKGLTRVGSGIDELLEEGILGYSSLSDVQ